MNTGLNMLSDILSITCHVYYKKKTKKDILYVTLCNISFSLSIQH